MEEVCVVRDARDKFTPFATSFCKLVFTRVHPATHWFGKSRVRRSIRNAELKSYGQSSRNNFRMHASRLCCCLRMSLFFGCWSHVFLICLQRKWWCSRRRQLQSLPTNLGWVSCVFELPCFVLTTFVATLVLQVCTILWGSSTTNYRWSSRWVFFVRVDVDCLFVTPLRLTFATILFHRSPWSHSRA